ARSSGVDRMRPLVRPLHFNGLVLKRASWIDDCPLWVRENPQVQNSAYGLLKPTTAHLQYTPYEETKPSPYTFNVQRRLRLFYSVNLYLSRRSCSISQRIKSRRCRSSSISRYSICSVTWPFI